MQRELSQEEKLSEGRGRKVNLTLSHSPSAVRKADEITERVASQMGFDSQSVDEIAISATEAVNNAIEHGRGKIFLSLIPSRDRLTIEVWDEGYGFDPQKLRDPSSPKNIMKPRGRGIFIMRSLMDEVRIEFGPGTKVTLVKYLRR